MTTTTSTRGSLSAAITESLRLKELSTTFETALLSADHTQVNHKNETDLWDYKEGLNLTNPLDIARLAKWVLGFHNAKGGVIILGVANDYRVTGYYERYVLDAVRIKSKIQRYTGTNIPIFQDRIRTALNGKVIWLIFVQKRQGEPVPALDDGPLDRDGRPIIQKDSYYIRVNDEVRRCVSPSDYELLFRGVSFKHLNAYSYEVDQTYYRLLNPHHDQFIGRNRLLRQLSDALDSRSYIIALDGVGGVGKSALAIEFIRRLYRTKSYDFIFSLSAKNRVWHKYTEARQAGFSGFTELITEMAKVFDIDYVGRSVDKIKSDVIDFMTDVRGLLLIDNIEEIHDDAVFNFLRNEVPEPVKILVTSRVSRDLGARTIPVPEMTEDEAIELLHHELDRVGYHNYLRESNEVEDILRVTGRLPLAIKWVGSLAANATSLKQVTAQIRRNDDITKREFLDFCFTTMYDELSDTAREVALLCPYLGKDWNTLTLSIALNTPTNEIDRAIEELEDRGILFMTRTKTDRSVFALPLTMDFLSNKWHQNKILRDEVMERISNVVVSTSHEGNLFNWPIDERIKKLYTKALELEEQSEYEQALKLTKLALQDSANEECTLDEYDITKLRFLEGRLVYTSEDKREGIVRMQIALETTKLPKAKLADEFVLLAQALLFHGKSSEEEIALRHIADLAGIATNVSEPLVDEFCNRVLRQQNYRALANLIDKINTATVAYWTVKRIWSYLSDKQFVYTMGQPIINLLRLASNCPDTSSQDQKLHISKMEEIKAMPGWKTEAKVSR